MALVLSFNITPSNTCKEICLVEKTSTYRTDNIGGWGTPNDVIEYVVEAVVKIAKYNNDGTFGAETIVNVFPDLPNVTNAEIYITATQAGQGDSFSDGIYRFIYEIKGLKTFPVIIPFIFSTTIYKSLHCNIDCCWQQMGLEHCLCSCQNKNDKFSMMSSFMRTLRATEQCGNLEDIQKMIDFLTKYCSECGCNC